MDVIYDINKSRPYSGVHGCHICSNGFFIKIICRVIVLGLLNAQENHINDLTECLTWHTSKTYK